MISCLLGLLVMLQASLLGAAVSKQTESPVGLSISWTNDPARPNRPFVEVHGLHPRTLQILRQSNWPVSQWQQILVVHAKPREAPEREGLPAMLGVYGVKDGRLRFEPEYPAVRGVQYRATFWPDRLPASSGEGTAPLSALFEVTASIPESSTVVMAVYPSAKLLPENLLKFYVHFSAPMSGGEIYSHIHLRDEADKDVELPFLEIDEELWDPPMKRLTLFIDPGRIKRGVQPLEEIGPALEEGKQYTLVIDKTWPDAEGSPLRQAFQKTFKVGPPDREPPDVAHWRIESPSHGTTEPLVVHFPEPMDHALALRLLTVLGVRGNRVEGSNFLGQGERRWSFSPERTWRRGRYQLVTQAIIEDLAGNNIGKPFEVDLFDNVSGRLTNSVVKLAFEIK